MASGDVGECESKSWDSLREEGMYIVGGRCRIEASRQGGVAAPVGRGDSFRSTRSTKNCVI